jgi:hypothetical protein
MVELHHADRVRDKKPLSLILGTAQWWLHCSHSRKIDAVLNLCIEILDKDSVLALVCTALLSDINAPGFSGRTALYVAYYHVFANFRTTW